MDEALRNQLLKLIEKYDVRIKEEDGLLTWSGFPDKRALGQLKMQNDNIIAILKERQ